MLKAYDSLGYDRNRIDVDAYDENHIVRFYIYVIWRDFYDSKVSMLKIHIIIILLIK